MRKSRGTHFDPEIHVTRIVLADRYGKTQGAITRALRKEAVFDSGMIIDRRPTGNVEVPFWESAKVIPLLDVAFGMANTQPGYKGEIVPARTPGKFKPLKLSHHRQADIEAAQPAMGKTMSSVGNGSEFIYGFGRGT